MRNPIIPLAVAALLATPSLAQQQSPVEAPATASGPTAPVVERTIPALTPIRIKLDAAMNSKANKIGEKFSFTLADPITVDSVELVPAGTSGSGDVVHAAKSRFGGKPGELLLAARYLDYQGVRIPLRSLKFDDERGKDNSGNAFAAGAIVSPLLTFMITGGEVNIPAGTIATAKTSADVILANSPPTTGALAIQTVQPKGE